MRVPGARLCVAALLLGLGAAPAAAQEEFVVIEPPVTAPSVPPLEILDLLAPPAPRGRLTLTPSIGASVEYDDNIFRNNDNKQSDVVFGFSPGISLFVNQPRYQLSASYGFTAEVHAERSELNQAFERQSLSVRGVYLIDPRLTVSASNSFRYSNRTEDIGEDDLLISRRQSLSNTLGAALGWQWTPRTSLRLSGSWTISRVEAETEDPTIGFDVASARDSSAYRIGLGATHVFQPRLRGTAGYEFAFLDAQDSPDTFTHSPRVGVSYQITRTLTGSVNAGPAFVIQGDRTSIRLAATANLVRVFRWGAISGSYNRSVSTFGGLGGTADTQAVSGNVSLSQLARGLSVNLSPRYSLSERVGTAGTAREARTLSVALSASYQVWRNVSVFGSYRYIHQRVKGGVATDVDQNRIVVGLRYAYPISFD